MKEITVRLSNSNIVEALTTIEKGGLAPLLHDRHARYINWKRSEGNILVGRIPYLRSKNLCLHEFRLKPTSNNSISIEVVATGRVYFFMSLTIIVGLLMCCIGVILAIALIIAINNMFGPIQEDLRQAIEAWDKTQSIHT